MAYLVDTDILIDYLRHQEAAADFPDSLGEWTLSVVSGMELVAGALDNNEVREIDTKVTWRNSRSGVVERSSAELTNRFREIHLIEQVKELHAKLSAPRLPNGNRLVMARSALLCDGPRNTLRLTLPISVPVALAIALPKELGMGSLA